MGKRPAPQDEKVQKKAKAEETEKTEAKDESKEVEKKKATASPKSKSQKKTEIFDPAGKDLNFTKKKTRMFRKEARTCGTSSSIR